LAYTTTRDDPHHDDVIEPETQKDRLSQSKEAIFERLMGYIHRNGDADKSLITERFPDGRHQVLCETNTLSVATAAVEMQAVALKNPRCKDPVYHFFLSWPETDSPTVEQIFESARHT